MCATNEFEIGVCTASSGTPRDDQPVVFPVHRISAKPTDHGNELLNALITAMTFAARHLLIVPIAIVAGCIIWTIIYVILLLSALIFNQGLGGPLAYPAGILAIVVPTIVIGWGVFAPASAVGAVFCALLNLPRLAAIPIVTAAAFGLSYLLYWGYIELVTTHSMPSAAVVLKDFAIFLSFPLGIYWWITEGPGAIFDVCRRWFRHRRAQSNQGNKTSLLTPDPPPVPADMPATTSTRRYNETKNC